MVVVGSQRANDGHLIMAAQFVTPAAISFMDAHRRGPICAPMLAARVDELGIPPMLPTSLDLRGTSPRVGVDHRWAALTGMTAGDRVAAIWTLADPASSAGDFTRPGQVVPLAYADGGVLTRPGCAEAAIDLVLEARLRAVAMSCKLADRDGNAARPPVIQEFASEHQLSFVSIEDVIAFRRPPTPWRRPHRATHISGLGLDHKST
jgi:3,4-dihydroxy 2-butanone 4-phosphate synthase/GTP cyclohydrolase II